MRISILTFGEFEIHLVAVGIAVAGGAVAGDIAVETNCLNAAHGISKCQMSIADTRPEGLLYSMLWDSGMHCHLIVDD